MEVTELVEGHGVGPAQAAAAAGSGRLRRGLHLGAGGHALRRRLFLGSSFLPFFLPLPLLLFFPLFLSPKDVRMRRDRPHICQLYRTRLCGAIDGYCVWMAMVWRPISSP